MANFAQKKMKIKSKELIDQLITESKEVLAYAEQLKSLSSEELNYRVSNESWSVLECLEHLNLYGRFYIPEMTKRINESKESRSEYFKSGALGNYFANSMLPKEKLNKMKTFKEMNPIHSNLDDSVIDEFISQQHDLLNLLEKARVYDLKKIKITISISKWVKLRLGDTFRFVINHNIRHIAQAKRVLNELSETRTS